MASGNSSWHSSSRKQLWLPWIHGKTTFIISGLNCTDLGLAAPVPLPKLPARLPVFPCSARWVENQLAAVAQGQIPSFTQSPTRTTKSTYKYTCLHYVWWGHKINLAEIACGLGLGIWTPSTALKKSKKMKDLITTLDLTAWSWVLKCRQTTKANKGFGIFFFPWINFGLFLQPQSLSTPFLISYIWLETRSWNYLCK